jgi:TonB family protein
VINSFKFLLFLSILPSISFSQELIFVKGQTSQGFAEQYHVLAANPKIRQGLYQKFVGTSASLMEEGYYKNNQKDSIWKYFDLNGNLKEQGNYLQGVISGNWKSFAYDNNIPVAIREGNYIDGVREGEWIFRKKNGSIDYKYDYTQKKITEYGKNDDTFTIIDQKDTITTAMDNPCVHIGGTDTLTQILSKNIKVHPNYPTQKNINGIYRVIISFNINENGRLEDYAVLKGTNKVYNEEALRVIKMWDDGNWVPGYYKGHAVKVLQIIPVVFNINYPAINQHIGLPTVTVNGVNIH